jgi:hypothetical protein
MGTDELTISKVKAVIERVASGELIQDALQIVGLSATMFYKTKARVRELQGLYAQAQEDRTDLVADEIVKIADDPLIDPMRAKNMVDTRKWRSSKQNSRVYGDRVELSIQQSISITDALSEARARVACAAMQPIIEAQVLPTLADQATDPTPDIYS